MRVAALMCHLATLPPIVSFFGLQRPHIRVKGVKNYYSDVQWYANIFFRFLHNSCYKLSLGCNASHFLMIYFWRLIKNRYSTNKNLKKNLKLILSSSTIDKKLENFEFIFEFKKAINFELISSFLSILSFFVNFELL